MSTDGGVTRRQLVGVAAVPAAIAVPTLAGAPGDGGIARTAWIATRDAAGAVAIDAAIELLIVMRYDARTPPCPAQYVRVTDRQAHPGRFRTADGAIWQIAEPVIDVFMLGSDGAAVQRAIDCLFARPGRVRLPDHEFVVTRSIRLGSGQTLSGTGWSTVAGSDLVSAGSRIRYRDLDIAIEVAGVDEQRPVERVRIEGVAITGDGKGIGLKVRYARHIEISDVYVNRAAIGVSWGPVVWQGRYSRIQCFNNRIGFDMDSGAEDATFETCIVRYGDVAVRINYHGQANMFIGCDFSYVRVAVQMIGGMTISATFLSCSFELQGDRGAPSSVFELLAPPSDDEATCPSVSVAYCRFHAIGAARMLPIFRIGRAGRIVLSDARPGGAFGAIVHCDDASKVAGIVLQDNARIAGRITSGDATLSSRMVQRGV